jgi:hypothetical protein
MSPTTRVSFLDRIRTELESLATGGDAILEASGIEYQGDFNRGGGVIFIAPDWAWAPPTDDLRRLQMKIVPRFDRWFSRFQLLFSDARAELQSQIRELHGEIREWLARDGSTGSGWDVPNDVEAGRNLLRERFAKLAALLDVLAPVGVAQPTFAIPDTSAIIDAPELEGYLGALGVAELEIVLVPGLLAELDALKDQGKNQDIRQKARAAGQAIKELRNRGSLVEGVHLKNGVRVVSRPLEPSFARLPAGLDPAVPDDRILGSALELQREHPAATVILVTGDINLQTKAELGGLPYIEPPSASSARS